MGWLGVSCRDPRLLVRGAGSGEHLVGVRWVCMRTGRVRHHWAIGLIGFSLRLSAFGVLVVLAVRGLLATLHLSPGAA